jgi:hypothetical protein
VAEQHHPLGREACPRVAVADRYAGKHAARRGERLAGDRVEILQTDRNAAERRRVAARKPLIRARRRRPSVVLVHAHPRVDRRRIAVETVRAVPLADPCQARVGQLPRGEDATAEELDRLDDVEVAGIARMHARDHTPAA